METRGRALYNLILMNWQEDPSFEVEPWQVEDYRSLATKEIFKRLKALGIPLDEERFKNYAEASDSPEELTDALFIEEELDRFDEVYLLVFELWRRLVPEKESLSIFCDQLDHLISLYDQDQLDNEEELNNAITELERILDEHTDKGEDPQGLFQEISLYCAHDLQSFIYDYASDQIDHNNALYASELIDGFAPYITDKRWFEFLEFRLLAAADPDEGEIMLARILEDQKHEPDFELLLEIARYLVTQGEMTNFLKVISQARSLIETEQDFQELLAISAEFCRLLDREDEAQKLSDILKQRSGILLEQEIASSDKHFKEFFKLFEDLDRSEA
jgi:DNA-binding XRE family transcriptional regulator